MKSFVDSIGESVSLSYFADYLICSLSLSRVREKEKEKVGTVDITSSINSEGRVVRVSPSL